MAKLASKESVPMGPSKLAIYRHVEEMTRLVNSEGKMNKVEEAIRANPKDFVGWRDFDTRSTFLMVLSSHGKDRLANILLEEAGRLGAGVKQTMLNEQDSEGSTALDYATTKSMRTVLTRHGAEAGADRILGLLRTTDAATMYMVPKMSTSARDYLRTHPE